MSKTKKTRPSAYVISMIMQRERMPATVKYYKANSNHSIWIIHLKMLLIIDHIGCLCQLFLP